MQNKTLLAKIVGVVALVCLALAMSFGLVACNNDKQLTKDDKVVASVVLSGDKFQVTYVDGTKSEYAAGSVKDVKVLENGQTEITYADGTKATVGDANCNHAFTASADVKPASCCEKGVKIQVCEKCGFVESVEVEKDPEVHGTWKLKSETEFYEDEPYVDEEEGIIYYSWHGEGYSLYRLETEYVCGSMTILEGYSGVGENCFEAECALCGAQFAAGHAPVDEWESVVVYDAEVNICENEHTVYKMCPICKSVLLYDDNGVIVTEKEPALGHIYGEPVIGDKNTTANPNYYPVTLTCSRCGEDQEVKAYKDSEVVANCKNGGYTTYKYSYVNYVDGVKISLTDTVDLEKTEGTGRHVVAEGVTPFEYYDPDTNPVSYQFTEDLKPFIDNAIKWNAGQPATCSDYKLATFDCIVCGEAIVVRLSGEHQYAENDQGTEVKPTCVYDGYTYKVCTENAGHIWKYAIQPAKEHNYEYQEGTFDVDAMTATFKCSCGSILNNIGVQWLSDNPATTCQNVSSTSYKATITYDIIHIDEYGVDMDPESKTVSINFVIENEGEIPLHTLANVEGLIRFESYDPDTNPMSYDYNALIGAQIKTDENPNGLLKWNAGIPGTCREYKLATFTCTVCGEEIVIRLSGEHERLDENDKHDVAATCTERGILEYKCLDCGRYVLQKAYDAKGHTFVRNAASWSNFLALENKDGAAVRFDCANCEEHITLYADKTTLPDATDACQTVKTDVYDFYDEDGEIYTYVVESKEGGELEKEFTDSWNDVRTIGSHTIGIYGGQTIKVAAYNEDAPEHIDSIPAYEYFLNPEVGVLKWNAGIPGNCRTWKFAVFTCTKCGESIVIHLSGVHTFGTGADDTRTVPATCTEGGYTEQFCTACERWIKTATTEALGHNYGEWTVAGDRFARAYEEDGVVEIEDYNLGYAISVCARCQHELTAEGEIMSTILPTCGKDGKLVVSYRYDGKTVATTTIVIPKIDHHITTLDTAEHVIKWADDGMYYLGYVCEHCNDLVVAEKSSNEAVIDALIAEFTADYVNELLGRA